MTSSARSYALALATLIAAGCMTREPGTVVELTASTISTSATRAALATDLSYEVQLDSFYVVLAGIELVPCTRTDTDAVAIWRAIWGPAVAHAHGPNTSTAWNGASVLAPVIDEQPLTLAVLHPPATSYCAARVTFEAADEATERMPGDADLFGSSMHITGSFSLSTSKHRASFMYESTNAATIDVPLIDSAGQPAVLRLTEDNLHATLQVSVDYRLMFDGLTLLPGAFSPFGEFVFRSMLEHVAVVLLDADG